MLCVRVCVCAVCVVRACACVCAQATFEPDASGKGAFELKDGGRTVVGLKDDGWTARGPELGAGGSATAKLLKKGVWAAIGIAKAGVDQAKHLYNQQGAICLNSGGFKTSLARYPSGVCFCPSQICLYASEDVLTYKPFLVPL